MVATKKASALTTGLVILIIIIIIGGVIYYYASKSIGNIISTVQKIQNLTNGNYSFGGGGGGGGPGQSYLSQNESSSIMGPGGAYNSSNTTNSTEINLFLETYAPSYVGAFNITGVYGSSYVLNSSSTSQPNMLELTFQTQNPGMLYADMLNYTNTTIAILNGHIGGMTYSYGVGGNSTSGYYSSLIGMKDNEVVLVSISGANVNVTKLASTVAGDIP